MSSEHLTKVGNLLEYLNEKLLESSLAPSLDEPHLRSAQFSTNPFLQTLMGALLLCWHLGFLYLDQWTIAGKEAGDCFRVPCEFYLFSWCSFLLCKKQLVWSRVLQCFTLDIKISWLDPPRSQYTSSGHHGNVYPMIQRTLAISVKLFFLLLHARLLITSSKLIFKL